MATESDGTRSAASAVKDDEDAKTNSMAYVKATIGAFASVRKKRIAEWLFAVKEPADMVDAVDERLQGTWIDNLALGVSALAGLVLGHATGSRIPAKGVLPVPFISLLGLGGVLPALWMEQHLTIRNAVSLGGLFFGVGAFFGARSVETA
ncbi:MAG: hypothetical protein R3B09_01755 [Nannocystaceae bacterium]